MTNNKYKILLVEDDPNIQSFVEALLTANGYQVILAQNAYSGFSLFSSHTPDLIMLDLGLPDRDGVDFIRELRIKYTTPIIVLSARSTESDKITALDYGANDYPPLCPANGSPAGTNATATACSLPKCR